MVADWSVEIGPQQPTIVVPWEQFVDLRTRPWDIALLPEAAGRPALIAALAGWNGRGSPLLTSKCDVWTLDAAGIDADEFDAQPTDEPGCNACAHGVACYVDLVANGPAQFTSLAETEAWARRAVLLLRRLSCPGHVELVLREARLFGAEGFGVTLYTAAAGASPAAAERAWTRVLEAAVEATMSQAPLAQSPFADRA